MSNQAMPNLPGFGAIAETMELVRNMWGGGLGSPGIGIPGMVMPTLSVDEINKQISDLKAVESWLTLNMNMLRGTIQALEVQSATISTLKSMGESLTASTKFGPGAATPAAASAFTYPFNTAATAPKADAPAPASTPTPTKAQTQTATDNAPQASTEPDQTPDRPASAKKRESSAGFAAPLANPAAWWNLLQDQFKHAVGNALTTEDATGKNAAGGAKKSRALDHVQDDTASKPVLRRSPAAIKKPAAKATRKTAVKAASKTSKSRRA